MIPRFARLGIAVIIFIICASCDILRDSPFEVSAWSPGGGYHANPESLKVSLAFSHDPDISSVEKYFSLTVGGESIRGIFHWGGRKMEFLPFVSLEADQEYSVRLSAGAHDTKGLSMDREFEGRFSTRLDSTRLKIVSFKPEMEGVMDSSRGNCFIGFSFPVSLNSLRSNASFNPSMSGTWDLDEGGMHAVFTPYEPWPQGKRFEMHISSFLEGENGINAGKDFFSVFTVGSDRELPSLVSAWRVTENGEQVELVEESSSLENSLSQKLGEFTENVGWEKGDRLRLVFSVPVDLLSVGTALVVENGSNVVLQMPGTIVSGNSDIGCHKDALFHFDRPPVFESRFSFRLRRGIKDLYGNESEDEYSFRIYANGKNSRPPSLVGIRLPMSPGGTLDDVSGSSVDLNLYTYGTDQLFADLPIEGAYYPYNTKTATWIECYFDCAPGAIIDPFSFMELFRVETSNNVLLFSPVVVRSDNFSVSDPHPSWEQYQRLEIAGTLSNTVNAGIVHFLVNPGLKDSAGNLSESQFRISLIK